MNCPKCKGKMEIVGQENHSATQTWKDTDQTRIEYIAYQHETTIYKCLTCDRKFWQPASVYGGNMTVYIGSVGDDADAPTLADWTNRDDWS
jgi:hypothetical protein